MIFSERVGAWVARDGAAGAARGGSADGRRHHRRGAALPPLSRSAAQRARWRRSPCRSCGSFRRTAWAGRVGHHGRPSGVLRLRPADPAGHAAADHDQRPGHQPGGVRLVLRTRRRSPPRSRSRFRSSSSASASSATCRAACSTRCAGSCTAGPRPGAGGVAHVSARRLDGGRARVRCCCRAPAAPGSRSRRRPLQQLYTPRFAPPPPAEPAARLAAARRRPWAGALPEAILPGPGRLVAAQSGRRPVDLARRHAGRRLRLPAPAQPAQRRSAAAAADRLVFLRHSRRSSIDLRDPDAVPAAWTGSSPRSSCSPLRCSSGRFDGARPRRRGRRARGLQPAFAAGAGRSRLLAAGRRDGALCTRRTMPGTSSTSAAQRLRERMRLPYGDPLLTATPAAAYGPVLYAAHVPFQLAARARAGEPGFAAEAATGRRRAVLSSRRSWRPSSARSRSICSASRRSSPPRGGWPAPTRPGRSSRCYCASPFVLGVGGARLLDRRHDVRVAHRAGRDHAAGVRAAASLRPGPGVALAAGIGVLFYPVFLVPAWVGYYWADTPLAPPFSRRLRPRVTASSAGSVLLLSRAGERTRARRHDRLRHLGHQETPEAYGSSPFGFWGQRGGCAWVGDDAARRHAGDEPARRPRVLCVCREHVVGRAAEDAGAAGACSWRPWRWARNCGRFTRPPPT